jgi:hypothetical protein
MRFFVAFMLCSVLAASSVAQALKTKNVVIVTMDGFRWRELFKGADEKILKKKYKDDTVAIKKYLGKTARERREKLMPFFWNTIASEGQLYGNRKYGNKVRITNPNFYSYSGYSEMFVGFVDERVKDNTAKPNPNYNVLQVIDKHPEYAGEVAVFSTWKVMSKILNEDKSSIHMNSGNDKAEGENITDYENVLNLLSDSLDNPLGERFDKFTFHYAMEYMKREKPRVVFISLDETDERAHSNQYVPYLNSANRADQMIGELWTWLQSQEEYKDQTTLIVGTDHGRGRGVKGWQHHRILFRGSAQVWLAVLGPDTPPTGEVKTKMKISQNQIAKTIAAFLGINYTNVQPVGEVITSAFKHDLNIEEDPKVLTSKNGERDRE